MSPNSTLLLNTWNFSRVHGFLSFTVTLLARDFLRDFLLICNKSSVVTTKKMGAQENECQIFENFKCVITILVKFDIHNSRTSMRNFLWRYYRWFITSSALEKCKTKNAIFFKLFCFFCFCPLKIKITQFPGGFCLKLSVCLWGNSFSSLVHFI